MQSSSHGTWNVKELLESTFYDLDKESTAKHARFRYLTSLIIDPNNVFYSSQINSDSMTDKSLTPDEGEQIEQAYLSMLRRKMLHRLPEFEGIFRSITGHDIEVFNDKILPKLEHTSIYYAIKALLDFRLEVAQYGTYEEAIHEIKRKYNHDLIEFRPEDDGKTHINVYSRGKTELGRLLSNFAHTPFEHYKYGYFSSVEAFWYWLSTGMSHNDLRGLHGFDAKRLGKMLQKAGGDTNHFPKVDHFNALIKQAILYKIETNHTLRDLLRNSDLPLTHYYVWGEGDNYKITYPVQYAFIHEYMEVVRRYLNGKAHKVLIAGSRTITDYEYIANCHKESGIEAVEFISGMAKGVDACCVRLAHDTETPLRDFPADWEKNGNSAGYIRNMDMGKYCTFAEIHWDGASKGTKHMIDILETEKVMYKVIKHQIKPL